MTREEIDKIRARFYSIPEGIKDQVNEVSRAAGRLLQDDFEDVLNEVEDQRAMLKEATRRLCAMEVRKQ